MRSVLEELYVGNVGFDSGYYPQNSPFAQAARRKLESFDKLLASLNDTEKELFEQYCDAQGDIEGITRYRTYLDALKFGILLMVEVYTGLYGTEGAQGE